MQRQVHYPILAPVFVSPIMATSQPGHSLHDAKTESTSRRKLHLEIVLFYFHRLLGYKYCLAKKLVTRD